MLPGWCVPCRARPPTGPPLCIIKTMIVPCLVLSYQVALQHYTEGIAASARLNAQLLWCEPQKIVNNSIGGGRPLTVNGYSGWVAAGRPAHAWPGSHYLSIARAVWPAAVWQHSSSSSSTEATQQRAAQRPAAACTANRRPTHGACRALPVQCSLPACCTPSATAEHGTPPLSAAHYHLPALILPHPALITDKR